MKEESMLIWKLNNSRSSTLSTHFLPSSSSDLNINFDVFMRPLLCLILDGVSDAVAQVLVYCPTTVCCYSAARTQQRFWITVSFVRIRMNHSSFVIVNIINLNILEKRKEISLILAVCENAAGKVWINVKVKDCTHLNRPVYNCKHKRTQHM